MPLALASLVFSGCATANRPASYRVHPDASTRAPVLRTIVAPLDIELSELTAGGMLDLRDDWTTTASGLLDAALKEATGWSGPASVTDDHVAAVTEETHDVQALLRAITVNHLMTAMPVGGPFKPTDSGLSYHTGPLLAHRAALGDGAVLFVLVRNSYATAGRKALLAFSLIGAGLTGVAIIPTMGSDVISAALVETDGTVLWFNVQAGGGDPRNPEGARQLAQQILAGLPRSTP